jgi:hypothetical protein
MMGNLAPRVDDELYAACPLLEAEVLANLRVINSRIRRLTVYAA